MKKVHVLLSVYNGERYLAQQLDSILAQQGIQVSLLVRDDASFDRTPQILASYAGKYKNISVYAGTRKGAAGSFFDLLARTGITADYYAFADQDDVWYTDKLVQAVRRLERESARQAREEAAVGKHAQPLLYAGKVVCASSDLERQERFAFQVNRKASFGNALVENICMGCTEVFNRSLLLLAREHLPQENVMHDWWMYLTASYFGKVIFDQKAYMLYRQHGNNAVGMQNRWGTRWKNRIRHMRKKKRKLSRQAKVFQRAYAGLPALRREDAGRLERLCGYRGSFGKRICLAADTGIYRQNRVDDFVCRLIAVLGCL
ncbi:MAG: glycosyltransferase family 2 protein [Eubacterium sp.]|nr:glycosyltransferase family 2 protein [Eubacterium sp.]